MNKKKKIGILTYHFTSNIGSFLQAYALQKKIKNLGYDSHFINYQKKGWLSKQYKKYAREMFGIFSSFAWPLCLLFIKYRDRRFKSFRKKYLKINSHKVIKRKNLPSLEEKFSTFIVGSDQVWNYNNSKFDYTYLFDFIGDSQKKNAYAPSFGVDDIKKESREDFRKHLFQFNYLSTREEEGQKIIKNLLNKECPIVLDPVLLIDKKEWENFAIKPKIKESYVLIYLRTHSESAVKFAKKLAKMNNHKVVQIVGYRKGSHKHIYIHNVSPGEWVGLFMKAKYIVTNSFHGVAFSINFKKKFFVEPKINSDTNSRILSITEFFSLRERIIKGGDNDHMSENINYSEIEKKLNKKRKESLKYLQKIAENNGEEASV